MRKPAAVAVGIAGVAATVAAIVLVLPRWFSATVGEAPPQSLSVERVVLQPGSIELTVRNGGQAPVGFAQVAVNDAYWRFEVDRAEVGRLQTARIHLDYPWVRGEPLEFELVGTDGQTARHSVEFPVSTPQAGPTLFRRYVPLGLFMGVIPVGAGMLLRPVLRRSERTVWEFFLAFTVGVLVAIGTDSAIDVFELAGELAGPLQGRLMAVTVAALSFALISEGARRVGSRGTLEKGLLAAWALAVAIGLHNLGEGLAVAGAEAAGAVAAGALLALGFAVHNVSEGVAIAAVMGKRSQPLFVYAGAIGVAGLPAVMGLFAGALSPSKLISVVLVAVGLGAIVEVIVEVWNLLSAGGHSRRGAHVVAGVVSGLGFMYLTSLLVG